MRLHFDFNLSLQTFARIARWRAAVALALAFVLPACGVQIDPRSNGAIPAAKVVPAQATVTSAVAATPLAPIPKTLPRTLPQTLTAVPQTNNAFSGQRAYETVQWLAETIGSRPAGSETEKRAADGLIERLQHIGYEVELQPFTIRQFEDRGSSLQIVAQPALSLTVRALYGSGSGTVRGRMVDVGLGRRDDLAGVNLRGAIALLRRGEIPFGEKVRNVARAGAAGAVIYNNAPGLFTGSLGDEATIPAVSLSNADGRRLAQLACAGRLEAELQVDAQVSEAASHNVVATWRGESDRTIVLGAHYDSVPEGPGANDNASGVSTVLELARVLHARKSPFTIHVVFFGSEEIGLVGSREYVSALSGAERERIVAMLNFDMVGVGDEPQVGGSSALVELVTQLADERGEPVTQIGTDASDHASFIEAGMPALFFYRAEDPNYHTPEDRAGYVEADHLASAGNLALALIERLAAQP